MAKVGVVRGGRSLEREISLRSGHHVASALRHGGHDVVELDVDERLGPALREVDAAFLALHGRDGEDGTIQSILEALDVAYTGSGPVACQTCFDKTLAKGTLTQAGIAVPDHHALSAEAVRRMGAGVALREAAHRIGYPVVVKPVAQGSALGLAVVSGPEDLSSAVMTSFNYGDRVLVERFVKGAELAVSVAASADGTLQALPPVEIRTASGVFDFEARVTPGGSDFLCPATLPDEVLADACDVAVRACTAIGSRDFARVDMICGPDGPVVLDMNPCPGLTETSLLPLAAAEAGVAFQAFVERMLQLALGRAA